MNAEQLKQDFLAGIINADWLIDNLVQRQHDLKLARVEILDLKRQLAERPTKFVEPYSLAAEERRVERKRTAKKNGRFARVVALPPRSLHSVNVPKKFFQQALQQAIAGSLTRGTCGD